MNKIVFKESQNMITKWLILLFVVILSVQLYQHISNLNAFLREPGIWILLAVAVLIFTIKLNTTYDMSGIHIRYIPLVWNKHIPWSEIQYAYIRTYSLFDFGGWGYRIGTQGTAINTKGKYGLQLELTSGRKIMIGTQCPEELGKIVKQLMSNNNESNI